MAAQEISAALAAKSPQSFFDELASEVEAKGYAIRDGVSSHSGVDPAACRAEAEHRRPQMAMATISTGVSHPNHPAPGHIYPLKPTPSATLPP